MAKKSSPISIDRIRFYARFLISPLVGLSLGFIMLFLILYGTIQLGPILYDWSTQILGIGKTDISFTQSTIVAVLSFVCAAVAFAFIVKKRVSPYALLLSLTFNFFLLLLITFYIATPILDVMMLKISAPRLCEIFAKHPKSIRPQDQEFCNLINRSLIITPSSEKLKNQK